MNAQKHTTILAIETSCDETGIAITRASSLDSGTKIEILANALSSQIDIHKETGGVVPEVAAREHVAIIYPMLRQVMKESTVQPADIDGVAVTVGPGLVPALAVGIQVARTLAFVWDKPIIPIHHIEGHMYSALLGQENEKTFIVPDRDVFPVLSLIVSGGHTLLIETPEHLTYKTIGSTRDDAVGEVFDKVARMMNLPYPGGPHISALAKEGNAFAYDFPRPMANSHDLDFSYSGLKTALLYAIREISEEKLSKSVKKDLCASFQEAAIDSLIAKVRKAVQEKDYSTLILAGGVAANARLRERIAEVAVDEGVNLRIAPLTLCPDNAVMIGLVAHYAYTAQRVRTWKDVDAIARLSVEEMATGKL